MEKVPRKKAKRTFKKKTLLFLLLAFAAACAGAVHFLHAATPLPEISPSPAPVVLLPKAEEEIVSMTITPPEGVSYPLVWSGEDQVFYLLGKEGMALRSSVIEQMTAALSELEAENTILDASGGDVDLSHYGLSPANIRIAIAYSDGSRAELLIGREAPLDIPQHYCMVSGDSHIYTILSAYCEPFIHEAEYLRDFTQPELDASLLDRIDISGALNLGMAYTPSGWLMDVPYAYPLSTVQTDSLLAQIENMAFEACLGSPDEVSLGDYGLDDPALTILLTQAPTVITGETTDGEQITLDVPQTQYTLLIGDETGASGVYLMWEGMVYKASNFLLGFWKELQVDTLLLRTPINLLINDLDAVTLTADGVSAGYEVRMVESITESNEIATDEYGQTLYDVAVRRTGETADMDAQSFLDWYMALAALTPAGRVSEGYIPSGEIIAEITLKNQALSRTISFYSYDALHLAWSVDGVTLFYTEKTWLDQILQTP